jgi:hypothetical protein
MVRRPLGVTLVAIVLYVEAVIRATFGIMGIVLFFLPGWAPLGTGAHLVAGVIGLLAVLVALILTWIAWGLLTMQPWAFWATAMIQAVSLVLGIVELTQPHPSPGAIIAGIIIPALVLLYFLLDRRVRAAFHVSH